MKYDFTDIISANNFYSSDSNLALREEFPIVSTRPIVFIPTIRVVGNDLFIDGLGLLIISLSLVSLTWFSAMGDITDCEGV